MLTTTRVLTSVLLSLFVVHAAPWQRGDTSQPTRQSAFRLTIVRDSVPMDATCVLVGQSRRDKQMVAYFITSARLFKGPYGQALPYAQSLTVTIAPAQVLAVRPADVFLPVGSLLDVAVFEVALADTVLQVPPLTFDAPAPGSAFLVSGFDFSGMPVEIPQRVGRVATLMVVGDRPLTAMTVCAGAPAVAEGGIFGIVTTCGAHTPPVIVPLSAIRSWLELNVPGGLTPVPSEPAHVKPTSHASRS